MQVVPGVVEDKKRFLRALKVLQLILKHFGGTFCIGQGWLPPVVCFRSEKGEQKRRRERHDDSGVVSLPVGIARHHACKSESFHLWLRLIA